MNEKIRNNTRLALSGLVLAVLCTGCQSAGLSGKDADLVAANSRAVGRVEGTVRSLEDTISDSRERLEIVARAGERIAGGVDRLEFLFTEYESEVERLLGEIDRLKAQLEQVEADSSR